MMGNVEAPKLMEDLGFEAIENLECDAECQKREVAKPYRLVSNWCGEPIPVIEGGDSAALV
jgi:hypothetical protein